MIVTIPISQIKRLTSCYRRRPVVGAYAAMLREGREPPPIDLIKRGPRSYEVIDGAHRLRAAKRVGRKTIQAIIRVSYSNLGDPKND